MMDVLRSSGRLVGGGAGRWLRDGAVVAEVALAFVLLVGSGLMIRTFIALQNANPGFDPGNTMTFLIQNNRAQGRDARAAFQRTMLERLKALPGVVDATSAGPIPLDGGNSLARFGPLEAATDPAKFQQAIAHFVQPGYFEFTRTPIIAGRSFTQEDNRPEAKVIIIDDLMAAQLFPNGNAVGQRMLARVTTPEPDTFEVIGVVEAPAPHHHDERRRGRHVLHRWLLAVRRGVPLGGAHLRGSRTDDRRRCGMPWCSTIRVS